MYGVRVVVGYGFHLRFWDIHHLNNIVHALDETVTELNVRGGQNHGNVANCVEFANLGFAMRIGKALSGRLGVSTQQSDMLAVASQRFGRHGTGQCMTLDKFLHKLRTEFGDTFFAQGGIQHSWIGWCKQSKHRAIRSVKEFF